MWPRRLRAERQRARRRTSGGAGAHTHLVEDAELLSQLGCELLSSGLHVAAHSLFNICSGQQRSIRAGNLPPPIYLNALSCLTWGVCGPQGAGSGLLVGLTVAGGQRFGHRCGGAVRGVGGPAQGELQGGTLREALKRGQTLQTKSHAKRPPPSSLGFSVAGLSHTFPSRMVSQVALFLLTGHSSVSCMDTSYSPSNSCSRLQRAHTMTLHQSRQQRGASAADASCLSFTCFYQRRSSGPQTWSLPPPAERSSSASCSRLPLQNLKQTRREITLRPAHPPLLPHALDAVALRGRSPLLW